MFCAGTLLPAEGFIKENDALLFFVLDFFVAT